MATEKKSTASEKFKKLGLGMPEIYLPVEKIDHQAWAVVACDQYSSEREYWEKVAGQVGSKPSTLNMIFPECYLEDSDKVERIHRIQASMHDYLNEGFLETPGEGFILVERTTPYEKKPRIGLLVAVDLEKYQYGKDSRSLIRPTEGTIVERLPPRMAIRRGAPLELPHIMILMDDPSRNVIEPLYEKRNYFRKLYDFDLMEGSGHVRGWFVNDEASLDVMASSLSRLADSGHFRARYGSDDVLLFAVGDGNHSLATAKATWEEVKASCSGKPGAETADILARHPARFALVELLNIYDEGLPFHPIHRVLFNVDTKAFFAALGKAGASVLTMAGSREAFAACDLPYTDGAHRIGWTDGRSAGLIVFEKPAAKLAAGSLQEVLDAFLKAHPATTIDYIHGSGSLESLASKPGNLGLYLPPVDKGSFFATVIQNGVMPRKTFSMGEAPEKRFYIEARKITLEKGRT
ncbi:MAG: DUF1015 domain-containing protein [Spirochaetae bacterium HGW-Spirochaetae-9]|nr:MAG: DUF1015 domain-containing protein [Spirochaetae bacterium HGW-Spirochaetae-9]